MDRARELRREERRARKKQGLPPLPDNLSSSEESTSEGSLHDTPASSRPQPAAPSSSPPPEVDDFPLLENALDELLGFIPGPSHAPAHLPDPPVPQTSGLWRDHADQEVNMRDTSADEQARLVSQNMHAPVRQQPNDSETSSSDDSDLGEPPEQIVREEDSSSSDEVQHSSRGLYGSKRQRKSTSDAPGDPLWFPWTDKVVRTCLFGHVLVG